MMDFLSFRRMLIPYLVQIVFWAGTALCLFAGVLILAGKGFALRLGDTNLNAGADGGLLVGLAVMLGGPLVLRVWCEYFIVPFRINETLTEMSAGRGGKK